MKQYLKVSIFSICLFTISIFSKAHVKLEYPKGGEVFSTFEVITIEWAIMIDHGDCDWDLLFSSDGGATWDTIAKNLPKTDFTYNWGTGNNLTIEGQIRVIQDNTNYGELWDDSDNFTISLTADLYDKTLTSDLIAVDTPYPNPGSGPVIFSFHLSRSSYLTIVVFDQLGRKLEILMNDELPEGDHEITWYSENLKPGNYFCRFNAEGQTMIRRVIRSNIP